MLPNYRFIRGCRHKTRPDLICSVALIVLTSGLMTSCEWSAGENRIRDEGVCLERLDEICILVTNQPERKEQNGGFIAGMRGDSLRLTTVSFIGCESTSSVSSEAYLRNPLRVYDRDDRYVYSDGRSAQLISTGRLVFPREEPAWVLDQGVDRIVIALVVYQGNSYSVKDRAFLDVIVKH